jgi:hypothetical protein
MSHAATNLVPSPFDTFMATLSSKLASRRS